MSYTCLVISECNFCIIEGLGTVEDFANMELQEIQDNIQSNKNKFFLLMEEVGSSNVNLILLHW